jgi:hypothetical protein
MLLTGCASVFDGGSKSINITPTSGDDVAVEIHGDKGIEKTTIPAVYSAKRSKEDILVKVVDDCYEDTSYVIQSEVTPAFFGNLLFGLFGMTGTTVDVSSGNMWKYDNDAIVPTSKKASCK